MSDEVEPWVKAMLREAFDPDVLLGRRPHGKRLWLVSRSRGGTEVESPEPVERPRLVLIRGGKED